MTELKREAGKEGKGPGFGGQGEELSRRWSPRDMCVRHSDPRELPETDGREADVLVQMVQR